MINLLPPDIIEMRSYGRKNRRLVRWCVMSLAGAAMLVAISVAGYYFITQAQTAAKNTKQDITELMTNSKLDQINKDYATFSANLKTVTQILSKQVLFSKLIQKMGAISPKGAILTAVNLNSTDNSISLGYKISSADLAPILQANLSDVKQSLFDKIDITQITCQTDSVSNVKTCAVQLKAQYSSNSQFLFLNDLTGAKK